MSFNKEKMKLLKKRMEKDHGLDVVRLKAKDGDVIKYYMHSGHLTFEQTIKFLAKRYGAEFED